MTKYDHADDISHRYVPSLLDVVNLANDSGDSHTIFFGAEYINGMSHACIHLKLMTP